MIYWIIIHILKSQQHYWNTDINSVLESWVLELNPLEARFLRNQEKERKMGGREEGKEIKSERDQYFLFLSLVFLSLALIFLFLGLLFLFHRWKPRNLCYPGTLMHDFDDFSSRILRTDVFFWADKNSEAWWK